MKAQKDVKTHRDKRKVNNKISERPPRRFIKQSRVKLMIAFVFICILLICLMIRLVYINTTSGEKYTKRVLSQLSYDSRSIAYKRGDITDRNGIVIAASEKVYNLILDPYVILNSLVSKSGDCVEPTIEALVEYFGIERTEIETLLADNPDSRYVILIKELSYDEIQPYNEMMSSEEKADKAVSQYIKGIWFEENYVRKYPYSAIAAHLIGFTSAGNAGTWGVEQQYNDTLNGTEGREYGYLTEDSNLERTTISAVNGNNVALTIDLNIQKIVDDTLAEFYESVGSANVAAIVMDPNNGEILAMANYPTYDLNNPRDLSGIYSEEEIAAMTEEKQLDALNKLWRNYCITNTYEPGSVVKVMSLAAAIEEDVVRLDEEFVCDGYETFKSGSTYDKVSCVKREGHGTITLKEALMYSCNDVLMQVAARIGAETFADYQKTFGFGQLTGIDLPGEATGLLISVADMKPIDLATNSFGQNYDVTMIQVASAFCSVINGGSYYKPHVVKEIITESGSIVEIINKELVKTTVSETASKWLQSALLATVEEGSGKLAQMTGYQIGGKTGTAEKYPRSADTRLVSFISCAPTDNPEVVIYVIVDEPDVENQSDSGIATQINADIMAEVLPYLQIFPEESSDASDTEEGAIE